MSEHNEWILSRRQQMMRIRWWGRLGCHRGLPADAEPPEPVPATGPSPAWRCVG